MEVDGRKHGRGAAGASVPVFWASILRGAPKPRLGARFWSAQSAAGL